MELMQESDSCREELEEEEEAASASASASAEEIITREESRLGLHQQHQDAGSNLMKEAARNKQLELMELSLGRNTNMNSNQQQESNNNFRGSLGHYGSNNSSSSCGNSSSSNQGSPAEKEHMFDKVVTPSDVGKLNRLVIPKQHAEKYFPLDSNANEKGLLLNFEDRNGKLWRFRYSYWNSSQSYVMTKGWSRFVKEKKLDAGDIVSFQRGVGDLYRHRLYIDWRRRPDHHHHHHHHHPHLDYPSSTALITPFFLPNQQHLPSNYSIRWGGRLYSLPHPPPPPPPPQQRIHHHDQQQQHFQHLNYSNMYPFHQQQAAAAAGGGGGGGGGLSHHYGYNNNEVNSSGSGSVYYLRSSASTPSMPMADSARQQEGGNNNVAPMIIDSVPVAHHHHHHNHHYHLPNHNHHGGSGSDNSSSSNSTAAKRLRLFGVNMECASSTAQEDSSSLQALQLLNEEPLSSSSSASAAAARFGDPSGGRAAVFFDLDPSLQYHHQ